MSEERFVIMPLSSHYRESTYSVRDRNEPAAAPATVAVAIGSGGVLIVSCQTCYGTPSDDCGHAAAVRARLDCQRRERRIT